MLLFSLQSLLALLGIVVSNYEVKASFLKKLHLNSEERTEQ